MYIQTEIYMIYIQTLQTKTFRIYMVVHTIQSKKSLSGFFTHCQYNVY